MEQLNRKPLSLQVADRIKEYIIENDLKPGDKLPSENSFIEILDVSRSTIREAIKQVQSFGILDVKPGRGAIIKDFDLRQALTNIAYGLHILVNKEDISNLAETRYVFELASLPLVVRRIDEERIELLMDTNERLMSSKSLEERRKHDGRFHRILIQSTGNDILIAFSSTIVDFFSRKPDLHEEKQAFSKSVTSRVYNEHKAIIGALSNRDVKGLTTAFKIHLKRLVGEGTNSG